MSALYTLAKHTVAPTIRGLWRPWTEGLAHIPAEGPAIIASNHLSVADSIFLPSMVSRPIFFWAKQEYFSGTGIRGRTTAAVFRG
ncbi:MAG TPA: 1-acyl-sn-glycerol-3-phosphate acyltransferase, partial [Rugosimonospora sp.]|nr:1-acyl-sn-glycerol-3-phosphate acyltransferase [Rugosimonospora sp.]